MLHSDLSLLLQFTFYSRCPGSRTSPTTSPPTTPFSRSPPRCRRAPPRSSSRPAATLKSPPSSRACPRRAVDLGQKLVFPPTHTASNPYSGQVLPVKMYHLRMTSPPSCSACTRRAVNFGMKRVSLPTHAASNPCTDKVSPVKMYLQRIDSVILVDNVGFNINGLHKHNLIRACPRRAVNLGEEIVFLPTYTASNPYAGEVSPAQMLHQRVTPPPSRRAPTRRAVNIGATTFLLPAHFATNPCTGKVPPWRSTSSASTP